MSMHREIIIPKPSHFDKYPNLIILRTFSKAYGLASLRVGYGVASSEVVSYLNRIRPPFNVNSLAQMLAVTALDDQDFVDNTIKKQKRALSCYTKHLMNSISLMLSPIQILSGWKPFDSQRSI